MGRSVLAARRGDRAYHARARRPAPVRIVTCMACGTPTWQEASHELAKHRRPNGAPCSAGRTC